MKKFAVAILLLAIFAGFAWFIVSVEEGSPVATAEDKKEAQEIVASLHQLQSASLLFWRDQSERILNNKDTHQIKANFRERANMLLKTYLDRMIGSEYILMTGTINDKNTWYVGCTLTGKTNGVKQVLKEQNKIFTLFDEEFNPYSGGELVLMNCPLVLPTENDMQEVENIMESLKVLNDAAREFFFVNIKDLTSDKLDSVINSEGSMKNLLGEYLKTPFGDEYLFTIGPVTRARGNFLTLYAGCRLSEKSDGVKQILQIKAKREQLVDESYHQTYTGGDFIFNSCGDSVGR